MSNYIEICVTSHAPPIEKGTGSQNTRGAKRYYFAAFDVGRALLPNPGGQDLVACMI